jgi:hypothetical protein
MILGLDVSSSMIGIVLLEKDGTLKKQSKIQLNRAKIKDEYDKIDTIKEHLKEYLEYKIEKIRVEAPLVGFGKGKSTAGTLAILNRFNGITCTLLYETFGIKPELVFAATARKKCKVIISSKETVKQDVLKRVLDICPTFMLEYTRQSNYVPGTFDMADAFVIAYSGV